MPTWIVRATREHYGAGEQWVYLVVAKDHTTAIDAAKERCGYNNSSTGVWRFGADKLLPEITEIAHLRWGGG